MHVISQGYIRRYINLLQLKICTHYNVDDDDDSTMVSVDDVKTWMLRYDIKQLIAIEMIDFLYSDSSPLRWTTENWFPMICLCII